MSLFVFLVRWVCGNNVRTENTKLASSIASVIESGEFVQIKAIKKKNSEN
jgi:hypothetical protein